MADTKISALPGATTPLAGTEVVPLVQSSTTKNVSVANLTAGRDVSALSLATTGNVGINTSVSPYYALNVDGSTAYQIAYFRNNNSTGYGPQIRAASDASSNSFAVQDYAGTNNYFVVRGDGNAFFDIGNVYSTGNFVVSTSGKGIDFSANSHAAGMTSELLNDYEEGTWTPQVYYQNATDQSTATDTAQYGWYTKVGRQVTITFQLTFSQATATGSLANDNIGVKNFPYAGHSGTGSSRIGGAIVSSMVTPTDANLYMSGSNTFCILITPTDTANLSNEVGTGSHTIYGTLTYFTA